MPCQLAQAEVLTDRHSSGNICGALPQMMAATGGTAGQSCWAYRAVVRVSWAELGGDARDSQAALNPAVVRVCIGTRSRLECRRFEPYSGGRPDCDVGCGAGWSAYRWHAPTRRPSSVSIVDEPSIQAAAPTPQAAGVADRARFRVAEGQSAEPLRAVRCRIRFRVRHDASRAWLDVLAAIHRRRRARWLWS